MNQNPYAPPVVYSAPQPAQVGPGQPAPWNVQEVLEHAWEVFKRHWGVLVLCFFIVYAVSIIFAYIPAGLMLAGVVEPNSLEYWIVYGACQFASMIVGSFFGVGLVRIFLAAARGEEPRLGDLFGGFDRFLPYLAVYFLQMLATLLGMFLCIAPGVIVALGLSFSLTFVVDARMGPITAMSSSWSVTQGHKVQLFVFALASILVVMLGFLACCVGILVALPVLGVAFATIYVRLTGRHAPEPA